MRHEKTIDGEWRGPLVAYALSWLARARKKGGTAEYDLRRIVR